MEKSEAIYIRLSENELKQIKEKMEVCNIKNMSAYILKMAIDGMIAKRLNEGKSVYASDIADIKEKQTQITDMVREIYLKLSKI